MYLNIPCEGVHKPQYKKGFPGGSDGKESACNAGNLVQSHSSILAWRIPWTDDPSRLQSTGSQSWTLLSTNIYSTRLQTLGKILKGKKKSISLACTGIMSVCVGNSTVLGLKLLQTMLLKCFIKKPCFLLEIERFKIATLMGTFVTFIKSIKEKTSQPRKQIQTTFT